MKLAVNETVVSSFTSLYENRPALIFAIIGALASAALAGAVVSQGGAFGSQPFSQSLSSVLPSLFSFIGTAAIGGLIVFLVKIFVIGAIISAVGLGAKGDINASIDRATRRYLNLLVTLIVVGILVVVGAVFLVIPGLYIGLRLSVAPMESVLGSRGVVDSLRSSWSKTSGNLWSILWILALIAIGTVLAGVVFSIGGPVISGFAGTFVSFAFIVAGTLIYQRLAPADMGRRRRKK